MSISIVESKTFNNDNLVLTLEYDTDLETYHVILSRKDIKIDMFDTFVTLKWAKIKFDGVQL